MTLNLFVEFMLLQFMFIEFMLLQIISSSMANILNTLVFVHA
jgi:hypothetical protein